MYYAKLNRAPPPPRTNRSNEMYHDNDDDADGAPQVGADSSHELFWSMGDSGPQLDTFDNGQNPDTLHGSIVRIMVTSDMGSSYTIPSGNPFSAGGRSPLLDVMHCPTARIASDNIYLSYPPTYTYIHRGIDIFFAVRVCSRFFKSHSHTPKKLISSMLRK